MSSATSKSRRTSGSSDTPSYSAPALDKGLDILELLASHGEHGFTQTQIAEKLNRSQSEFYRMLACLVQRGYIRRGPHDENYRLTAKLFELAHRHPPTRRLIDSALPAMRAFAEQADQSCHLVVHREHQAVVITQVDSPTFVGVSVRSGAVLPLHETVSGRVLASFEPEDLRNTWLAEMQKTLSTKSYKALASRISEIQEQGHDRGASQRIQGVYDLSVPVFNHDGYALAALSVPCLLRTDQEVDPDAVLQLMQRAAKAIEVAIGASLHASPRD